MNIEVPYSQGAEESPFAPETSLKDTPEANPMATPINSPAINPSTSPSTVTITNSPSTCTCPASTEAEPATSPKQYTDFRQTVDPAANPDSDSVPDADPEHELLPFGVQFSRFMSLGYPDEDYYSTRYSVRLPSGYWVVNEIPLDLVVENIPTIGFVNEYNQPIPSLVGPDVHLTLASMNAITRIGEENDPTAMSDLGQVFYLNGPRKGQLNDAYAWIALRGNEEDKFVMSRRARNRLVPNWKDMIPHWKFFDECIPDPCDELRKVAVSSSYQAWHWLKAICALKGLWLAESHRMDILEGNIDCGDLDPNVNELLAAAHQILAACRSFEDAVDEIQAIVDDMEV